MALWGQTALTACYALLLFEITELAGFNLLRILFALGTFTTFSLFLLTVVRHGVVRVTGGVLFVLLVWANLLHYRYFGSTIQLGSIYNIGFVPYLGTQIAYLMKLKDLLFPVFLIIIGFTLKTNLFRDRSTAIRRALFFIAVYLFFVGFQFFAETQSSLKLSQKYSLNETRMQIYKNLRFRSADHVGSVLQFGILWTAVSDFLKLRGASRGEIVPVPPEDYAFDLRRAHIRNIVAIQVESLDRNIIGFEYDGQPVTPFLNRLSQRHGTFTNLYAQHSSSGGTSDGDFCFLTSQYPLGYKGSLGAVGLEHLPSLPRILNNNGYATLVFHAHKGSLYHRKEGFQKLGFAEQYFREQFDIVDPDRWHTLKDRDFFNQVAQILNQTPEPFFAFLITLSSHGPFDLIYPEDYVVSFEHDTPLLRNYFSSIRYVDASLEAFVKDVLAKYPNTVFLLYGDHSSNIRHADYTAMTDPLLQPIAAFYVDMETPLARRITRPGSTIDLGPTLFDLLGFRSPEFFQGRSLVSDSPASTPVLLKDSKYYLNSQGEVVEAGKEYPGLDALERIQKYLR